MITSTINSACARQEQQRSLIERARDEYGCQIWDLWTGSYLTGWTFTCKLCAVNTASSAQRGSFDTFEEAFERAGDHWNGHQPAVAS